MGTVDEVGEPAPRGRTSSTRLACVPPVSALPLWVASAEGWDGRSRIVPVRGHAVLSSTAPAMAAPPGMDVASAVELALAAHVPRAVSRAVGPAARVTVLGATTTAGALAVMEAKDAGAEVAAVVSTLQEARLARALGGDQVVVGDLAGGAATAHLLAELGARPADVTIVALGDRAILATAAWVTETDGTILVLGRAETADVVAASSSLGGRHRIVLTTRGLPSDDRCVVDRFTSNTVFNALATWRAGVGPLPAGGLPEDR